MTMGHGFKELQGAGTVGKGSMVASERYLKAPPEASGLVLRWWNDYEDDCFRRRQMIKQSEETLRTTGKE